MSGVLVENQFEISDADGSDGFVFGTESTGYLTITRPQLVAGDPRLGDRDRPQEDGRMLGRDYYGGKSINFEMGVLTDGGISPLRDNLDHLDLLETIWTDERWRDDPNAYAMLRVCEGGQTWRCYGRPRRYDEVVGKLTRQGYSVVMASFDLLDGRFYSDTLNVADAILAPSSEGGLTAPLTAPLTTIYATTSETEVVVVNGSRPTWPVIEFHGPVTNPRVTIGGVTVGVDLEIASGDTVVIDPRPWVRSATRNGGAVNVAGNLHYKTPPMRALHLRPGVYEVNYEGLDTAGASRCEVSWRHARSRP